MSDELKPCPYCGNTRDIHTLEHGVVSGIYPELAGIKPCYGGTYCRGVWGDKE